MMARREAPASRRMGRRRPDVAAPYSLTPALFLLCHLLSPAPTVVRFASAPSSRWPAVWRRAEPAAKRSAEEREQRSSLHSTRSPPPYPALRHLEHTGHPPPDDDVVQSPGRVYAGFASRGQNLWEI